MAAPDRIDVDRPIWRQDSFEGRLRHFFWVTDFRTCFVNTKNLYEARNLLEKYRQHQEPSGTTVAQVRYAQKLCMSAFHPDSGELQNLIGRMSFQVPGGMILIGCMVTFYRTNSAVVFWQWANQSFNALVNYTNRNADSDLTPKKIATAYVSATFSALVTALGLKAVLAKTAAPVMLRFVPFAAVSAANIVNVPLMRQSELINGVTVFNENNQPVTSSRYAAVKGISQVVLSRIIMASPGLILLPMLMEHLEKYPWMKRIQRFSAPLQVLFAGVTLLIMTPTACAIFPQKCSIKTDRLSLLDKDKLEDLKLKYGNNTPQSVHFNKGL